LLRRSDAQESALLSLADLSLDARSRKVWRGGRSINLSAREFAVLEFLLRHTGEVISRTRLAEAVWDENFDSFSNVIDVTVYHLRDKIDRGCEPALIKTVRGAGYVMRA
jgi:DNA-binding response OmpR family regulator